ncbi:MAG: fatty acid--CoA ligase family protein [bacterium]
MDDNRWFSQIFEQFDKQTAIISNNKFYSYSDLLQAIIVWEQKLNYIKTGQVVGLEADFSLEAIAILFTLIYKKATIVSLDIKQNEKNLIKYKIAKIETLIKVYDINNIDIINFDDNSSSPKPILYEQLLIKNVPGLVLFTSGSSGQPKAAVHDFSILLNKFKIKRNALKTVNFLLFDHWGGLNTLFHILSNGGTIVTLNERTPDYVCEQIEKYKVELLPASPSFLNLLLLSHAHNRWNLSSLKIISYGTEPMPESLLRHLNKIFPNVSLRQTYGLIELGVLRSKSEDNNSLWVKIGGDGYQTRVIDGILQIKAESAMLGYLNAPSPFTHDNWFITGDSVEVKGDYYKILGRKSEIINVGGEKVFPQEVENIILEINNIKSVTVFGQKNPILGNIVCAKIQLIEESDHNLFSAEIKRYCNEKLARYKVPVKFYFSNEDQINDRFKKNRRDLN